MAFLKLFNKKPTATQLRNLIYNYYYNKYFSLFMNSYEMDGVDYQQKDFILRKFWADGQVACFKLKGTEGSEQHPQGLLVFTPFAVNGWNLYDWPTSITLINTKGLPFIPATPMKLDEEAVIGFAQRNKKPVLALVEPLIQKITDVEMVIRANLNVQKMPWLITGEPEVQKAMKEVLDMLQNDEPQLWISSPSQESIKALVSGAPYILDKLYDYKGALENELREFLGINNMGAKEKKEHLINSEIEANDQITKDSENCFFDSISEFFERIKEVLGVDVEVKLNKEESDDYEDINGQKESDEEEEIQDDEE